MCKGWAKRGSVQRAFWVRSWLMWASASRATSARGPAASQLAPATCSPAQPSWNAASAASLLLHEGLTPLAKRLARRHGPVNDEYSSSPVRWWDL